MATDLSVALQLNVVGNSFSALDRARKQVSALRQMTAHAATTFKKTTDRIKGLGRSTRDAGNEAVKAKNHFSMLKGALAGGSIFYGLKKMTDQAIDFESTMADVRKVVAFDSPEQFKKMGADILNLSTRIPMAADGLGDIMAAAGGAGIARNELLQFTQDAAKMGVAFDMSGKAAGSAMTGLRAQFGLNQRGAVALADSYNHLSNSMDAKAVDMLNIANRAGSTARMVGLTGQQLGALSATFLALKTPPEVAATGINALVLKLGNAHKQGDRFKEALGRIGFSASGMASAMKSDAQGTIVSFLERLKQSKDVMGDLTDMFGMEYSDDIAKLVGGLGMYKSAIGLVSDQTKYAGSMNQEYSERAKTTANNLILFKNKLTQVGIEIMGRFLPALNTVLKIFQPNTAKTPQWIVGLKSVFGEIWGIVKMLASTVGNFWTKISEGSSSGEIFKSIADKINLLGSVLNPVLSIASDILAGVFILLKKIASSPYFQYIAVGIGAIVVATKLWNTVIKANPFMLVVSLIIAGIGLLIANWDTIKTYFSKLWDWVKNLFKKAWDSGILPILLGPVGIVIKHWSKIKAFFTGLWSTVKKNAISVWNSIIVFIKAIPARILSFFSGVGSSIINTISDGITGAAGKAYDSVKSALGPIGRLLPKSDAKEGPLSQLTYSGQSLITTFAGGIKSKATVVKDAVSSSLGTLPKSASSQRRDYVGGNADSEFSNVSKGINIDFSSSKFYLASGEELTEGSSERLRLEEELRGIFSDVLTDFA